MGHAARLQTVLRAFPAMRHAFAYGSGVFAQPGLYEHSPQSGGDRQNPGEFLATSSPSGTATHVRERLRSSAEALTSAGGSSASIPPSGKPMLDFIFAVDDPHQWHFENIRQNPTHYSWLLSKLGSSMVCAIAEHAGVGIHFNTLVPLGPQMVKYGVTGVDALQDDLRTWRHLYLAGRLHKPVLGLLPPSPELQQDLDTNVSAAVASALLLLPRRFTTAELLQTVVGLSYHGDIRMAFAEDPHKIQRIVDGSRDGLAAMYEPLLSQQTWPGQLAGVEQLAEETWEQSSSEDSRMALTARLPVGVLHEMSCQLGFRVPEEHLKMEGPMQDILTASLACGKPPGQLLQQSLAAIVRRSSGYQALSGLLSVSGIKSLQYVRQKLTKAWSSSTAIGAGKRLPKQ